MRCDRRDWLALYQTHILLFWAHGYTTLSNLLSLREAIWLNPGQQNARSDDATSWPGTQKPPCSFPFCWYISSGIDERMLPQPHVELDRPTIYWESGSLTHHLEGRFLSIKNTHSVSKEDIYTVEYYSAMKKNEIMPFCSNMDEPWDYHTRWSKSERER